MQTNERYIYLDWAASTPLCIEAREAMEPYLIVDEEGLVKGANANSLHSYGRNAFAALEEARNHLMQVLGVKRADEMIFTSGATEANNAALFGIIAAIKKNAAQLGEKEFVPHIITTEIEHDSVLAAVRILGGTGCETSLLKPDAQGFIEASALESAFRENTVLVSIQYANNEIGSIQAIEQLAHITHERNAYFHTDAVQVLGKMPLNLFDLGVDAASFSAHKISGPKGIGALYVKNHTPFQPFLIGGGQEFGKRSGTQNVCAAAAFAAAAKAANEVIDQEPLRLRMLRDYLYASCCEVDGINAALEVDCGSHDFLPNIVNVLVDGFESETLILRLDMKGFAVSGGSACSTNSLEPSHVLRAIGITRDAAYGSLRVSIGRSTHKEDLQAFINALKTCLY